jgi:hypothetical protein
MTQGSGDGPSRREGDSEPHRDDAEPRRAQDQDVDAPAPTARAPAGADADSAPPAAVAGPPADEPPPEETGLVDLTTVEPPEPAQPPRGDHDDSTVVVLTDRTLRETDEPELDEPPPLPPPESIPGYDPPAYTPHVPTPPAWLTPRSAEHPYSPDTPLPSASGAVPADYETEADETEAGPPGPPGPPGSGGVPLLEEIPGGWQAVRRRHRRQTATFLVALLGVLGLGAVAGLMFTGRMAWPFGGRVNVSAQVCTPAKAVPPKRIHLRVYNGSSRAGLARAVAAQLKTLGFVVQETGNDPLEAKVTTAVEIRYGETGELAGKTASAYFAGKIRQRLDDRTNDVVDVVLGPKFTRLNTRSETTRALTGARSTLPLSCPPGVTPPPTPTPTPSAKPGKKGHPTPTPSPSPKR